MKKLDDKGNVAIILCLLITVLFAFTAYVVDVGMVYKEKIKLSNAIDAAAYKWCAAELDARITKAYEKMKMDNDKLYDKTSNVSDSDIQTSKFDVTV